MFEKNKYIAVAILCTILTATFAALGHQSRSLLYAGIFFILTVLGLLASVWSALAIDSRIISAEELSEFCQKYPFALEDLRKLTDNQKRPIASRDLSFLAGKYAENEWEAAQDKLKREQITQQFSKLP